MDSPRCDKIPAGMAVEREEAERPGGGRGGGAFKREYSSMPSSCSILARFEPKSSLDSAITGGCWRRDDEKGARAEAVAIPEEEAIKIKKGTEIVGVVD